MWLRSGVRLTAVLGTTLTALALSTGVASAHKEFSVGPLDMEMGFLNEPAYTGQPNGTFVSIMHGGRAVEDVGNGLQVEVIFGGQTKKFTLAPLGKAVPGDYVASFIPTSPGAYTFHLFGTVEGQKVDRTFTSGPQTFDEVQDPAGVEFPVQVPATAELATRIDREVPRLTQQIAAAKSAAEDDASSAKSLATIGIVVGAIGLLAGGVGTAVGLRRRTA